MTYSVISNCIDLMETGRKFQNPLTREKFGFRIAIIADEVIRGGQSDLEIDGIRKCLKAMVKRVVWWNYIWIIPVSRSKLSISLFPYDEADILTESIMITIAKYRQDLDELHSGLRTIVLNDICQGIEVCCVHSYNGGRLKDDQSLPRLSVDDYKFLRNNDFA